MNLFLTILIIMNYNEKLNENYQDFFQCTDEEVLVYGGSGAGKSYSIADKLLLQAIWQRDKDQIKIVVTRKTLPSLRRTAIDILQTRAKALNLEFVLNRHDWEATCYNLKFVFLSLNNREDFEKLKSLTNVDFFWNNELLELRERDYEEELRRLRGGQSDYQQIMSDFNPEDEFSWVNDRFFVRKIGNPRKFRKTVHDNHPVYLQTKKAQNYVNRLKRLKDYDVNQYRIFYKGLWGKLQGIIFKWDIVELPETGFDEIFYGGDFGFSVDPAALVKIYRKADHFWLQELLYMTDLTNQALAQQMRDLDVPESSEQFWDSAEPKSIRELRNEGFNAMPSLKGPDSVRFGIDCLLSKHIHIVDGSENLIREVKRYTWKTNKDGKSMNVPIEDNDHAIKATQYAIYTKFGHKESRIERPATVDIRSWG